MDKIAIIGGSGFKQFSREGVIFLERHGPGIPPHMVDHKKNVSDLKDSGVTAIIGICSVGSLKLNIEPGSIVIPHDYINLFGIQTYHDLKAVHITPGLDGDLRKKIIGLIIYLWKKYKKSFMNVKIIPFYQKILPKDAKKKETKIF